MIVNIKNWNNFKKGSYCPSLSQEISRSKVIVIEIAINFIYSILMALLIVRVLRFNFTKTPLFTRLLLVLFSIVGRTLISAQGLNWIFMAIVIIFLGGIIVVFVYASRLNFRKKNIFHFSFKKIILFRATLIVLNFLMPSIFINEIFLAPFSLYSGNRSGNLVYLALYLLMVLLLLIKIVSQGDGPIKTQFL